MKQCPVCKATYSDPTLRYCLADGNPLNELTREQETEIIQGGAFHDAATIAIGTEPARVEMPRETVQMPEPGSQTGAADRSKPSGAIFKFFIVVIGLGIFGILAVAAGTFIYFNMNGSQKVANVVAKDTRTNNPPTPSPTKDDQEELRDQIANLERLINDQKKTDQPANVPFPLPNPGTMTKTARVNSPSDGFLALRTLPSSDIGERIAKIPHGATISLGVCGPVMKPVSRRGRWCTASYEGQTGWVFDAYLIY